MKKSLFKSESLESLFKKFLAVGEKLKGLSSVKKKAIAYSIVSLALIFSFSLIRSSISNNVGSFREIFTSIKPNITFPSDKLSTVNAHVFEKQSNSRLGDKDVGKEREISWQPIEILLASTEERRKKVAQSLGIAKGEYYLAVFSISCDFCDKEALNLNNKKSLDKIIAISNAPKGDTKKWQESLGLKYRVESVSEVTFDHSGAVFLPTIIHFIDGKAVGASETASPIN